MTRRSPSRGVVATAVAAGLTGLAAIVAASFVSSDGAASRGDTSPPAAAAPPTTMVTTSAAHGEEDRSGEPPPSSDRASPTQQSGSNRAAPPPGSQADNRYEGLNRGDLPLEVRVEPDCVRRGGSASAHIVTEPGAYISLVVTYKQQKGSTSSSDVQATPMYAGPTQPDGTLTFPWTVQPDAPEGEGVVFVAAKEGPDGRESTSATPFTVVKLTEQC